MNVMTAISTAVISKRHVRMKPAGTAVPASLVTQEMESIAQVNTTYY